MQCEHAKLRTLQYNCAKVIYTLTVTLLHTLTVILTKTLLYYVNCIYAYYKRMRADIDILPNQELSVLYGGPLSIMGDNYPCMFPICCA